MAPDDFDPPVGQAQTLAPRLRRIVAPNPSPMTYRGTNTYLLGEHDLAVIDPGPAMDSHLAAILGSVRPGQRITHILVTHSHVDHSPLAADLARSTGAPVLAFGDSMSGRSDAMCAAVDAGLSSGGEGVDRDFKPTTRIGDGQTISAGDQQITALHTPGHMGNHMCFSWGQATFCGDLVMGWASSLVSPPDGDLTDFMASCARLQNEQPAVLHSGHGAPIETPADRLDWLITHRKMRERQILEALNQGAQTSIELARSIYTETPAALLPAATRNVFAHLIDLLGKKEVSVDGTPREDTRFKLA